MRTDNKRARTKREPGRLSVVLGSILAFAVCISAAGCSSRKPDSRQVIVFAAASTTNAVTDIAADFTKKTGVKVITSFAASSTLAQQIENGADVDVFISANQAWADYLQKRGYSSNRRTIVSNRIVIVVPAGSSLSADSADILASPRVKDIAMADPSAVPAGKYGKQALEKLGLWDKVKAKVTSAKDVRSALAFVETEAAEAGIVYSTDAAISDKVKVVFTFPADATAEPISYPAMTMKHAVDPETAGQFLDFLKGDDATGVFKRYGFITE